MISLGEEYYKYHSGKKEEQGLATGGHKLDFLSDLVASYLFEKVKTLMNRTTYHIIYWDDVMVVLKRKSIVQETNNWLAEFIRQWKRRRATNISSSLQKYGRMTRPPPPLCEGGKGSNCDEWQVPILEYKNELFLWWGPAIWNIQEKEIAIKVHWDGKYPHTWYPMCYPIRSLQPPCKAHLAKNLFSLWRGRKNLPQPLKITPQGGPCPSYLPNNGKTMETSR